MATYQALCPNESCGQKIDWENNQHLRNLMLQSGSGITDSHMQHDVFCCPHCGAEGCSQPGCGEHWAQKKSS
ncbi:MAG: hypothetical protein WCT37_00590 [Patescibacteria group bacterium]